VRQLQLLTIISVAIMTDWRYTPLSIASALNVFAGGDVTVNVSKKIPLQVYFKLDSISKAKDVAEAVGLHRLLMISTTGSYRICL
jgi:hypothetical protein